MQHDKSEKGKIMRLMYLFLFVFLCVNIAVAQVPSQETHLFSIHDMLAMDRISNLQVSPDGKWIVFVLQKNSVLITLL